MPRRPRLFVAGGIYHVYCRTHRGEMRFGQEPDSDAFLEIVSKVSTHQRLEILGWVLMTNHYHLVVRTGDIKLWRAMSPIQAHLTRAHNRRHRVFGPGWQSRYRARLIQDDIDLRHLLAYVHLNPVVAGLVDDPADYELSSHRALIGRAAPVIVDTAAALRCFGEETLSAGREAYLKEVRCVAEAKWARGTLRQLPWWRQVKDDHETVDADQAPPGARTFDDRHPDLPPPPAEEIEHLLARACRLLGVAPAELSGSSRKRSIAVARRRFTYIASCCFNRECKEVAVVLRKSQYQVSRWLTLQLEVCALDASEAELLDGVVCRLLQERD